MEKNYIPNIQSKLRHHILKMPEACYSASGIIVNGRRIKTFVFTTDLAIIRNCDADAVFAVYPFTPQQAISDAIIKASYIPVFCGVGGGTIRDVLAGLPPYIFVKHIYACASIAGGIACALLWRSAGQTCAVLVCFSLVFLIRILAARFRWSLPKAA